MIDAEYSPRDLPNYQRELAELADRIAQSPDFAPGTIVTAEDVAKVAVEYDSVWRGGTGRGDIDEELAAILAAWINARLTRSGYAPKGGGE